MKFCLHRLLSAASFFGRRSRASSRPLPYHQSPRSARARMAASDAASGTASEVGDAAPALVVGAASVNACEVAPVIGASKALDTAPVVGAGAGAAGADAAATGDDGAAAGGADAQAQAHVAAVGNNGGGVAAGAGGGRRREGEWFRVSDSVTLTLHRGSITNWFVDGKTDAIVNAANSRMLGGGGVDGAIHREAGPQLLEACKEVPEVTRGVRCPVGEARITKGFHLPASTVIHTVGPIYDRSARVAALLGDAYRSSLRAAIEHGIKYIAFPAISCGIYGYPAAKAASVSLSAIREASDGLSEVHFVLFEQETYSCWMKEASKQFHRI